MFLWIDAYLVKLQKFTGDEEIIARSKQTDVPEEDNRRTFMAMSTLELYVNKSHHGRIIRCVAIHESYPSKSQAVDVRLDITCKCFLLISLFILSLR